MYDRQYYINTQKEADNNSNNVLNIRNYCIISLHAEAVYTRNHHKRETGLSPALAKLDTKEYCYPYHNFRRIKINDNGLKSSIFFEGGALLSSGRRPHSQVCILSIRKAVRSNA